MRKVGNKNTEEIKTTTPDLEVFGNPDIFRLIAKVSSETEGWMRSTKAMHIPHIGVVLHVSQLNNGQISDALEFIPGVKTIKSDNGSYEIVKDDLEISDLFGVGDFPNHMTEEQTTKTDDFTKKIESKVFELIDNLTKKEEDNDKSKVLRLMHLGCDVSVKMIETVNFFDSMKENSPAKRYAAEVEARFRGFLNILDFRVEELLKKQTADGQTK